MNKDDAIDVFEKYDSLLRFFEKFANELIEIDQPHYVDYYNHKAESMSISYRKEYVELVFGEAFSVFYRILLDDAFKPREEFLLKYKEKLPERQEAAKKRDRELEEQQARIKETIEKLKQDYDKSHKDGENLI